MQTLLGQVSSALVRFQPAPEPASPVRATLGPGSLVRQLRSSLGLPSGLERGEQELVQDGPVDSRGPRRPDGVGGGGGLAELHLQRRETQRE